MNACRPFEHTTHCECVISDGELDFPCLRCGQRYGIHSVIAPRAVPGGHEHYGEFPCIGFTAPPFFQSKENP